MVGTNAFVFGGLDPSSRPPVASDQLFALRLRSREAKWEQIRIINPNRPLARYKHSAILYEPSLIIYFGGFHSNTHRLNDVWVFNTVTLDWWQPVSNPNIQMPTPRGNHPSTSGSAASAWPCPRGGHTATLIRNRMYVFGGYGGYGYARRDLDDLQVLDLTTWQWLRVTPKGVPPERRSGHQACAVEDRLFIIGGWNSATQLKDIHVLDTLLDPPVWTKINCELPIPRWNHSCCCVAAIPNHKIFVFGGTTGELSEADRQGVFMSDIQVLDTGTLTWASPPVQGDIPMPRSDSSLDYDIKGSKIFVFGGFANRWYNDLYSLDVSSVVGPPYAITSIFPVMGPVTGGSTIEILGIDFVNTVDVVVRFACKKGFVDVRGMFVSSTKITCLTPDFRYVQMSLY